MRKLSVSSEQPLFLAALRALSWAWQSPNPGRVCYMAYSLFHIGLTEHFHKLVHPAAF